MSIKRPISAYKLINVISSRRDHDGPAMPLQEQINRWHALIASYKLYRHEFDYFFLYTWFDTYDHAMASQLSHLPRHLLYPMDHVAWEHHLCVDRLPSSIWSGKINKQTLAGTAAHLREAQDFSSFLLAARVNEHQESDAANTNGDDNKELPAALRSMLPPEGLIAIKLEGVKSCREFALDCLNARYCNLIWPRYFYDASYCTFNWYGRTFDELYHVLPEEYRAGRMIYWLPNVKILVASLHEKSRSYVLRRCIDVLDRCGEEYLANTLRKQAMFLSDDLARDLMMTWNTPVHSVINRADSPYQCIQQPDDSKEESDHGDNVGSNNEHGRFGICLYQCEPRDAEYMQRCNCTIGDL